MNINYRRYRVRTISIIVLGCLVLLFSALYIGLNQGVMSTSLKLQPPETVATQSQPTQSSTASQDEVDTQQVNQNPSVVGSQNSTAQASSMQGTAQIQNTTSEPAINAVVNASTAITPTSSLEEQHQHKSFWAENIVLRQHSQQTCTTQNKNMLCWSQFSLGQKPMNCVNSPSGAVFCWR